jgi:hypothetical protein
MGRLRLCESSDIAFGAKLTLLRERELDQYWLGNNATFRGTPSAGDQHVTSLDQNSYQP